MIDRLMRSWRQAASSVRRIVGPWLLFRDWPMPVRLSSVMTALVLLTVGSVTVLSIQREQRSFQAELQRQAELLVNSLTVTAADALYFLNLERLNEVASQMQAVSEIEFARFYDDEGHLLVDSAVQGRWPSMEIDLFGKSLAASDETYFEWREGQLVAGRAVTVGRQRFGAVCLSLSTTALEAKLATVRAQGLTVAGLAVLAATLLALLFSRSFLQPLRGLVRGTRRVAAGDLKHPVVVQARDELGVLADAFNDMTVQLQQTLESLESRNLQLETTIRQLKAANDEIRSFANLASHDLRAPVLNIRGFGGELSNAFTELLSDLEAVLATVEDDQRARIEQRLREDIPEALGFIQTSTARIDDMSRVMLELARLGASEPRLEHVDLNILAQENVRNLSHRLRETGAKVEVGILPEVVADASYLQRILGNLLDNAVKYLDPLRPGYITISGERRPEETCIWVRDNGSGIAPEDLSKIFQVLRRACRSEIPGEGMGLAYVQTLVRKLGGRIECQSTPGTGTTFTFSISNQLQL